MPNTFCGFLSNGLFISDKQDKNLVYKPCCLYEEKSFLYDKNKWKDINDWTNACNNCFIKESGNKKSKRQEKDWFTNAICDEIIYLEIDYSNVCNAACGMCNSMESNTFAQFLKKENNNLIPTPKVKLDDFYSSLNSLDLSKIKVLKFKGGEPFYSNFHKKLLKKVGLKNNNIIMYQTNGSIYPDNEWWDMVKDCKEVHLSFSVDGVGKKFDFIRGGLNFMQVEENIISIISNKKTKISFSIECTINPLNAFYFDEIFSFFIKLKKYNNNATLNWHQCWGHWGLENVPLTLREIITKKYKKNNMCNIINSFEFDPKKFIFFINSIRVHEKRFNLDCKKIFPEIYPYLKNEYEKIIAS